MDRDCVLSSLFLMFPQSRLRCRYGTLCRFSCLQCHPKADCRPTAPVRSVSRRSRIRLPARCLVSVRTHNGIFCCSSCTRRLLPACGIRRPAFSCPDCLVTPLSFRSLADRRCRRHAYRRALCGLWYLVSQTRLQSSESCRALAVNRSKSSVCGCTAAALT